MKMKHKSNDFLGEIFHKIYYHFFKITLTLNNIKTNIIIIDFKLS